MYQRIQGVGLGLIIATAVVALAAFGTTFAQNEPQGTPLQNPSFVYQGRLTVDGIPAEGWYYIRARFFDEESGGSHYFESTEETLVTNGVFSLQLPGSAVDGDRIFLEIAAQAQGSGDEYQVLGPRQEITPAPYAIYAMTAGNLSSSAAAGFIQNGTSQQPASNFNISGDGTAGGTLSAGVFALDGLPVMRNFGSSLFAVGPGAGNDTATGLFNTMLGGDAGLGLTTGSGNTAVGKSALLSVSTGSANVALGSSALVLVTTGSSNVALGRQAGYHVVDQSGNTFLGNEAGFETLTGANTAVGYRAGRHFTTGAENVFVGSDAGKGTWPNSTGSQNVAVGTKSGFALLAGSNNSLLGDRSGEALTTGSGNTLLGKGAGAIQTTGSSNVFAGVDSGSSNVGGTENTFIGPYSGLNNVSGNENVALGTAAGFSSDNLTYATAIGAGSQAIASDQVQLGRSGIGTVRIGSLATTGVTQVCVTSDKVLATCSSSLRYKTNLAGYTGGLDILERLRPVTFDWKSDGTHDLGFVAEDVAAIDPLLATYRDGQVEGVKYDRISAVLVNSVMEQQAQIDALSAGVAPETGSAIEERLTALESEDSQPWLLLAGIVAAALIAGAGSGFFAGRAQRS